jgi:hypothetical protein
MRSIAVFAALSVIWIAPLAYSNGPNYASLCPNFQSQPTCPVAPGAMDCARPEIGCGLDALPSGLPCSGTAQCSLVVYPCPDWQGHISAELNDGYICSCVGDRWSCDDCNVGEALCALAPDAAPLEAAASGEESPADSGMAGPGSTMCIPRTRYVAAEPCPSMEGGNPYTTFECTADCLEFHALSNVTNVTCKVGGVTDANVTPLTDADTIVLCCPGEWDAAALPCEPPFQ